MDLRQLEHFLAVAEEQSFTRAARRIHAGQSTLSVSVRSLERELGTALFERTTHRVALTDAGEALLPEARRTLEAAERAREVVAEVNGVVRGTLRVGIMRSLKVVDVASMLARFHRKYPGVEIQPRPAIGGSAALAQQVATGQLDLAFLAVPPDPVPDLSLTPLASEPFLLVAASDELDDAPSVLALNELQGRSFVDFPLGWGVRTLVDRAFAAAGINRNVAVEVGDVDTLIQLVGAGFGLGYLPGSLLAPQEQRVATRTVTPELTWEVAMVLPKTSRPSAATRAFVELVLSHGHGDEGDEPEPWPVDGSTRRKRPNDAPVHGPII